MLITAEGTQLTYGAPTVYMLSHLSGVGRSRWPRSGSVGCKNFLLRVLKAPASSGSDRSNGEEGEMLGKPLKLAMTIVALTACSISYAQVPLVTKGAEIAFEVILGSYVLYKGSSEAQAKAIEAKHPGSKLVEIGSFDKEGKYTTKLCPEGDWDC
jgi:hypothetical protein